jgi:uncharacterized protein (TIGR02268 family)
VFQQSSVMSLLLTLVVGSTAAAQPGLTPEVPGVRHIELGEDATNSAPEVAISPGLTTAFRFHGATLDREEVKLQGRDQVWVSLAEESILLVPSEQAVPGQRFRLTVPFKGGMAPARATFILVVQSALAERQVEVYRRTRPSESLRAEVREKDAQLQSCREQVARLRVERNRPQGLTGLIAAHQLDEMGVVSRNINHFTTPGTGESIHVRTARSFRSVTWVAVELWLDVPEEAGPWNAEGAVLRGMAGEELSDVTVWQDASISHGTERRVVVEAAAENMARGPFVLKLWGEGRRHAITLGNVTFP